MNVAIVYRNLTGLSGVPSIVFAQAKALTESGCEVDLLVEKVDRKKAAALGLGIVRVGRIPGTKRWRYQWFARRADRIGHRYDFVIGHGHNFEQNVLYVHNCIRLQNEKLGGGFDNPDALLQDEIFKFEKFRFGIANSKLMSRDLVQRYGLEANKIHVVYPGFDCEEFNSRNRARYRDESRKALNLPEKMLTLGLITSGAFNVRGLDILLKGYAKTSESVRRMTHLLVIGRSSDDRWRALAHELGLNNNVFFMPVVKDVIRYYSALDIGIHPARFETFGMSVQEMMACGIPMITNRQVGATELLPSEAYRQLPVHSEPDDLAIRIERFVREPEMRRQWSEYGLAAAANNSFEINFQKSLEIFRKAGLET